jgi:hypothetical protein
MEERMNTTIYNLTHHHPLEALGSLDRLAFNGKAIGNFTTLEAAARAHEAVENAEGFRDWPDGFRVVEFVLDTPFFSEGFEPHPDGDIAIAGDSSCAVGNDTDVDSWGQLPPEYPDEPLEGDPERAQGTNPGGLWELAHFKVGPRNEHAFMESGGKIVGLFTTAEKAKAAIATLRDKPGFNQWPGGWRIFSTDIDSVNWKDGFVADDED